MPRAFYVVIVYGWQNKMILIHGKTNLIFTFPIGIISELLHQRANG